jgi:TetR/AcrR family transcriptional repressor of mexJK operon
MSRASTSSIRKKDAILEAAKRSFLAVGFTATNLDDVAADAAVSKMTIYSHFGSKEDLFIQMLQLVIAQRSAGAPPLDAGIDESDLRGALQAIALDLVETVQSPEIVGLRRVLIAEQTRHPGLAAAWRRSTVLATVAELTRYFDALQQRGLLHDVEPPVLAGQFLWLLIGDVLDAALLDPGEHRPTAEQRAQQVVDLVLAAFAPGRPDRTGPQL